MESLRTLLNNFSKDVESLCTLLHIPPDEELSEIVLNHKTFAESEPSFVKVN